MCFTKGQWLQMKATSRAGATAKSARVTFLPSVSGRRKSGALVPSGAIVEGVAGIEGFSFLRMSGNKASSVIDEASGLAGRALSPDSGGSQRAFRPTSLFELSRACTAAAWASRQRSSSVPHSR